MLHCYHYYPTGNIGMFSRWPAYLALLQQTHFDQGNARLAGLLMQLDLTGNEYNMALVCYFSLLVQIPRLIRFTDHVFRHMYSALLLELVTQLLLLVVLHV